MTGLERPVAQWPKGLTERPLKISRASAWNESLAHSVSMPSVTRAPWVGLPCCSVAQFSHWTALWARSPHGALLLPGTSRNEDTATMRPPCPPRFFKILLLGAGQPGNVGQQPLQFAEDWRMEAGIVEWAGKHNSGTPSNDGRNHRTKGHRPWASPWGKMGLQITHTCTYTNMHTHTRSLILVANHPSKALCKQLFWEMLIVTELFLMPLVGQAFVTQTAAERQ